MADADLGREMDDAFEIGIEGEDRARRLGIADVEIVEGEVGVLFQLGEARLLQLERVIGVHVIDADDLLAALKQALRHMHPEEAGRAGDENGHGRTVDWRSFSARRAGRFCRRAALRQGASAPGQ